MKGHGDPSAMDEENPEDVTEQNPAVVDSILQAISNSHLGKDDLLKIFQAIHSAIYQLAPDLLDSSTSDSENLDPLTGKRKSKEELTVDTEKLKLKKLDVDSKASTSQDSGTNSTVTALNLGRSQNHSQYPNITQNKNQQAPTNNANTNVKTTLSSKPPPIVIRNNQKWRETRKLLLDNGITFNTAKWTRDGIKIQTSNMSIYRKALDLLRDSEHPIQHHTFLPAEDRDLHVVIRGIGMELPPEEAFEELQALDFHPRKILRMKHPISQLDMPLLLVVLPKDENSRRIYNIKQICDIIITVEPLRNSPVVGQCRRCQLFGHSHTQCFAEFRCKHCAQNHDSKTCNKNAKNETDIWCCNCGGQHRASYRGCDRAPGFRAPMTQAEPAPRQGPAPSVNERSFPNLPPSKRQPAPGKSFSQPFQQQNTHNQSNKTTAAQVVKKGLNNKLNNSPPSNQKQLLEQMQATMHSMSVMLANMVQLMNNQCQF